MDANQNEPGEHSTDRILIAAADMAARKHAKSPGKHLDIGSGDGTLIRLLNSRFSLESSACDYTDTLMKEPTVKVTVVNLNSEKLPYDTGSFDLVTCTEVIEHLEHYRETLQETYRVLNEKGTLVVTTPNILNLKSRIRFLVFGFYNLFGPLHFRESALHSAGGHITPISLFYLIHSLVDAGFGEIEIAIDKRQSTSLAWLVFLYIPIRFFGWVTLKREQKKYKTVDEHNIEYISKINSLDILTGRTIIVGCKKSYA
jgi:SAM-dependent methyltransferase